MFDFNWASEAHCEAFDAFELLAEELDRNGIARDDYMEVLFVVAFTHHLHFSDRESLITLVDGGLAAIDQPIDVETNVGKTLH